MSPAVLVTGSSSGIGRAVVQRLVRVPHLTVFASARRMSSIADLGEVGAQLLELDVTDEASMRAAVDAVEAEHGSVGILVNNAGFGAYGTIEETDLDLVRSQFETNVFGLARMTQLVLPGMRAAGGGRIVNIGSMGGRVAFPVAGYYHASKHALEALSDALRFEVRPFGVLVSLIEPGPVRTGFGEIVANSLASTAADSPYASLVRVADEQRAHSYASKLIAADADAVANVVEDVATSENPPARVVVGAVTKFLVQLRRIMGSRVFDAFLRRQHRGA